MLTIILLIIAVSFDAMSFGLAQGIKNIKITPLNTFIMSIVSTILFTIPLYLSYKFAKLISEHILNLVNGIVLILLGLYYLISYLIKLKKHNTKIITNKNTEQTFMKIKAGLIAVFPISLDAIFTAILNGYTLDYITFGIVFYFFMTFLSIFLTNMIGLKLSNKTKIDLGFLSSLIFITIGILKLFGI